jgi:hypothetical protein
MMTGARMSCLRDNTMTAAVRGIPAPSWLGDLDPEAASVFLYWLPLGAGDNTHCVRTNGKAFEFVQAAFERRARCDLYHSALVVHLEDATFTVEMGPAWGNALSDRGVVDEGPVGMRCLGRSRFFRYEVRCWRSGLIADVGEAVGGPVAISTDVLRAEKLLALIPRFPTLTWGRDEMRTDDMWNSNSLTSWLLAGSGHDVEAVRMPLHGRAPGWSAGLDVAARAHGLGHAKV